MNYQTKVNSVNSIMVLADNSKTIDDYVNFVREWKQLLHTLEDNQRETKNARKYANYYIRTGAQSEVMTNKRFLNKMCNMRVTAKVLYHAGHFVDTYKLEAEGHMVDTWRNVVNA